jgi:hypothetical protein
MDANHIRRRKSSTEHDFDKYSILAVRLSYVQSLIPVPFQINPTQQHTAHTAHSTQQQTADSRQQTVDSRQQTADSRQQTADSRQQTADSREQTDSYDFPAGCLLLCWLSLSLSLLHNLVHVCNSRDYKSDQRLLGISSICRVLRLSHPIVIWALLDVRAYLAKKAPKA